MIQANELRIGNWVKDWFTKNEHEIQIDLDDFQVIGNYTRSNHPHPYKPIPLTEEWLLKFGFEIDDSEWFKDDDEIVYQKTYKDYSICVSNKGVVYNGVYRQRIKHVHSLQNLCFALTGEELTIKN